MVTTHIVFLTCVYYLHFVFLKHQKKISFVISKFNGILRYKKIKLKNYVNKERKCVTTKKYFSNRKNHDLCMYMIFNSYFENIKIEFICYKYI